MKTIIALAAALFTAPAFADHNRVDQYGLKQGHWTVLPDDNVATLPGIGIIFLHGEWVFRFTNGIVHEGEYVGGKKHGHWVERYANGEVHEGEYVDGKKHGHWVLRFADGTVQEGTVVDGKQHGLWVSREVSGNVIEFCMENGNKLDC